MNQEVIDPRLITGSILSLLAKAQNMLVEYQGMVMQLAAEREKLVKEIESLQAAQK